ncbi:MAG TPA: hypothetical protein DDW84_07390 [Phycisphaerales bacterium]|nr:MAG: hypothetical protein A2Y13_02470 [Planctomycetes bacterium GWC2_45_44]HBG78647.1 hypothetical protein [Phycisphaerales bacterium]HBR18680.1 hypothetical protein [Phycisphaerales bacterium]
MKKLLLSIIAIFPFVAYANDPNNIASETIVDQNTVVLGVKAQPLDKTIILALKEDELPIPAVKGIFILSVIKHSPSPAFIAGLKDYDLIIKINDITVETISKFNKIISANGTQKTLRIVYLRMIKENEKYIWKRFDTTAVPVKYKDLLKNYTEREFIENAISTDASQASNNRPNWVKLTEGVEIYYDQNYQYHPAEMKLSNGMLLRSEDWTNCLKGFVESIPANKRYDVIDGITRFYFNYDKFEKAIKFEPLRYISGPYASNSYISLKGSLTNQKTQALLKVQYMGDSWIFADRIKIVADDFSWQSPTIEFYRDSTSVVWEYTYFDLANPEIRNLVDKIISANEVVIRFIGPQYYSDFDVPNRMKTDIAAMLKAIDTINRH